MKYLALLRGINVGGNNIIKKDALKACFEAAGLKSVLTYIQSGNILFSSDESDKQKMAEGVQRELKKKLKNHIEMVIFTEEEYSKMLAAAHKTWGKDTDQKHNALFLLKDMSLKEMEEAFPEINGDYEQVSFAEGVVFWSGSKEHYTKTSYVKQLVKSPLYKQVTIRNSNTSFKLQGLFERVE